MSDRIKEINDHVDYLVKYSLENDYKGGIQQLHEVKQAPTLGTKLFRARLYWATAPEEMKLKARNLSYIIHWDQEDEREERYEYQMDLMRKFVEIENKIKQLKKGYYV